MAGEEILILSESIRSVIVTPAGILEMSGVAPSFNSPLVKLLLLYSLTVIPITRPVLSPTLMTSEASVIVHPGPIR